MRKKKEELNILCYGIK